MAGAPSVVAKLAAAGRCERHAYSGDADRPLGSFMVLMGAYGVTVTGLVAALRARGTSLPERLSWRDLGLAAVATHKLSRLLAKDPVTSPLRAPFTTFSGKSGEAEVAEEVRGSGPRHAIGELVTCPVCLSQWIATGFAFGMVAAPRPTRLIASAFTTVAGADILQLAYARAQEAATA